MIVLDRVVDRIAHGVSRPGDRKEAISLLEGIVADCNAAVSAWKGCLDKPAGAPEEMSLVGVIGRDVARELFHLHLAVREKVLRLAAIAGTEAGAGLDDEIIKTAYRGLEQGETGADAARAAIAVMEQRIGHIRELIQAVRTTKPVKKPAATKKKAKKAAKAKTKARKATGKKRAKKKTAKKKTTRKKAVKKKAAKKKKPAKKKAVKKKAAKKAVKKKAARATKKKAGKKKKTAKKKAAKKKTAKKKPARKKTRRR